MSISETKKFVKRLGGKLFKNIFPLYPGLENLNLILMYHRVLKELPKGLYDPSLFVTAETFKMHLKEVSRIFEIVPLEELLQAKNGKRRLCAITFDDGWIDNYEVAFPILKEYKIPATIFLPTKMISEDGFFWFEGLWELANRCLKSESEELFTEYFTEFTAGWNGKRINTDSVSRLISKLYHLPTKRLNNLVMGAYLRLGIKGGLKRSLVDWVEVSEMGEIGISFGSHGLNHYNLLTLEEASREEEIFESLKCLQRKGIRTVSYFSYPYGFYDGNCVGLVAKSGYSGALTLDMGFNNLQTAPYLLKRVGLHEYMSNSPSLFWFRIFQGLLSGSGPHERIYCPFKQPIKKS